MSLSREGCTFVLNDVWHQEKLDWLDLAKDQEASLWIDL